MLDFFKIERTEIYQQLYQLQLNSLRLLSTFKQVTSLYTYLQYYYQNLDTLLNLLIEALIYDHKNSEERTLKCRALEATYEQANLMIIALRRLIENYTQLNKHWYVEQVDLTMKFMKNLKYYREWLLRFSVCPSEQASVKY